VQDRNILDGKDFSHIFRRSVISLLEIFNFGSSWVFHYNIRFIAGTIYIFRTLVLQLQYESRHGRIGISSYIRFFGNIFKEHRIFSSSPTFQVKESINNF